MIRQLMSERRWQDAILVLWRLRFRGGEEDQLHGTRSRGPTAVSLQLIIDRLCSDMPPPNLPQKGGGDQPPLSTFSEIAAVRLSCHLECALRLKRKTKSKQN